MTKKLTKIAVKNWKHTTTAKRSAWPYPRSLSDRATKSDSVKSWAYNCWINGKPSRWHSANGPPSASLAPAGSRKRCNLKSAGAKTPGPRRQA